SRGTSTSRSYIMRRAERHSTPPRSSENQTAAVAASTKRGAYVIRPRSSSTSTASADSNSASCDIFQQVTVPIDTMAIGMADPRPEFIEASLGHGSLERSQSILTTHPEIASSDIHTAAILGDDDAVRRFLEQDPANATAKGGPRGWDALTHLCFSRY